MSQYIMAIDQGTTSTRTCIFDRQGGLIGQESEAYPQIYPQPGWVEHNPADIWNTTQRTIKYCLEKNKILPKDIAAIGITNQRETVILWDQQSGKPVHNAIVWQCRRTHDYCLQLKKKKLEKWINQKTGLLLDPYFSASKVRWILKNAEAAKRANEKGHLRMGTVDSFLLWHLTGGQVHKTDISNASRTMLMNIKTAQWDSDLCKLFSIPSKILPQISSSSEVYGHTQGLSVLPDGIPISGIAGDQQAALFGQAGFRIGDVKCTFGTGSFILLNTGDQPSFSKNRLLTTVAWRLQNQKPIYALEGGAFVCGAAVQWLRDGLGLIKNSSEVEDLAASVDNSMGVEFVPALTGLGAPHWKSEARGLITGLTRGTTKAHIARATLEAMSLQNVEILQVMEKDLGRKLKSIKVDGGACRNNLLVQIQADHLGIDVIRPKYIETTALGAAYFAGLGIGFWRDTAEIQKIWQTDRVFSGRLTKAKRAERLESWKTAVMKT